MRDLATKVGGRPVLIPSADQFVSAIAEHADVLKNWYVVSPGIELQGRLATKRTQYELAREHGMPMPRTMFAACLDEVEAFAAQADYPCLIKPMHFREWHAFPDGHPLSHEKVAVASTPAELVENWRLASAVNPNVVLQEIIHGPDTAKRVYLSCYDAHGRRIAHALFRELRCDPIGFGPATVSEPVHDPEADDTCDRFLQRLGYVGICEIEVKRDPRDGRVKLIEANPRLSGGGDAAPHAGVDLCWLHYLDLIGQPVRPVGPTRHDFRHVVLRPEGRAIIAHMKAGLITWRDLLRSYRPPLAFYDFDRRDIRYSWETIAILVRGVVRELLYWRRPLTDVPRMGRDLIQGRNWPVHPN
jgi:predicted ATP-grasp superfamily ATP-dependent carboligase